MFFGYRPVHQADGSFLIAEPEKAILDTLYLYSYIKDELDIDGLRLNYDMIAESCKIEKLQEYATAIANKRVLHLTKTIVKNLV